MISEEYQYWLEVLQKAGRCLSQKKSDVSYGYAEQAIRSCPIDPHDSASYISCHVLDKDGFSRGILSLMASRVKLERIRALYA